MGRLRPTCQPSRRTLSRGAWPFVSILSLALLLSACGADPAATGPAAEWEGTVTTEGGVTTVVNEGGSVWGGTAQLVEDLSIGVETGEPAYLFGRIVGLATHESRIYVLDAQVPVVRVFDALGRHVLDIGGGGQGPGEFERPRRLAVDARGTVYVSEDGAIEVFSPDGTPLTTWSTEPVAYLSGAAVLVAAGDDAVFVPEYLPLEDPQEFTPPWDRTVAIRPFVDGVEQELRPVPEVGLPTQWMTLRQNRGEGVVSFMGFAPPFAPERVAALAPDGTIVVGWAGRYEFELHRVDGMITKITKSWNPIPVQAGEAAWYLKRIRRQIGEVDEVSGWDPDSGIPDSKPAFRQLIGGKDGSIWVIRAGVGRRRADCAEGAVESRELIERPCWQDGYIVDVFGPDGRYLGDVEMPEVFYSRTSPFLDLDADARASTLLTHVEDELGTIMVKRYRIVLPRGSR